MKIQGSITGRLLSFGPTPYEEGLEQKDITPEQQEVLDNLDFREIELRIVREMTGVVE